MALTAPLEYVRRACESLRLPIDDDEAAVVSALLTAYAPTLEALRQYSAEDGLGYGERAIVFAPPPDARPLLVFDVSAEADPGQALGHAASAIRLIRQNAATNAFIAIADIPEYVRSGPLNGINFAVKDCIAVAGEPTTLGSSFAGRAPAALDSPIVSRLRDAGACYVGKTNLGEFALTASSVHFGEVANPWNLSHTAGGSSGGSAAAVASGEVDIALGTDNAGSVRIPAAMCGVVGYRPSTGSLPLEGIVAPAWTLDGYGLLARDARTIARIAPALGLISRPDSGQRPVVLGVVTDGSLGDLGPEVEELYRASLGRSVGSTFELRELSLSGLELAAPGAALIAYVEIAMQHERWIRRHWKDYGAEARPLIALGCLFSGVDYTLAQRARLVMQRRFAELIEGVDVIVTPTIPLTAPFLGGKPSVPGAEDKLTLFDLIRFTALANMVGAPAASIPIGLTSEGLPVGAQIMGSPWADELVLRSAIDLQDCIRFDGRPPFSVNIGANA
jgi:aspartyl-tRNA(Asn)/glutamyl-tRNA(Gln) amidotransferase subunit A